VRRCARKRVLSDAKEVCGKMPAAHHKFHHLETDAQAARMSDVTKKWHGHDGASARRGAARCCFHTSLFFFLPVLSLLIPMLFDDHHNDMPITTAPS